MLSRCFMIWLIATNHIRDSKKAKNGDNPFNPLDEKMRRKVPILWSMIREKKIRKGRMTQRKSSEEKNDVSMILAVFGCKLSVIRTRFRHCFWNGGPYEFCNVHDRDPGPVCEGLFTQRAGGDKVIRIA